jgi:hypothetical protein
MKTIAGVPETVAHEQVLAAVKALGFDPKMVRSLTIGSGWLEVEVYATTPVILKFHTDLPATHTVFYDLLSPVDA